MDNPSPILKKMAQIILIHGTALFYAEVNHVWKVTIELIDAEGETIQIFNKSPPLTCFHLSSQSIVVIHTVV